MTPQEITKLTIEQEIEKITKHRDVLQDLIKKLVDQLNDATEKRRIALEAAEAVKMDLESTEKKLAVERSKVGKEREKLDKERTNIVILKEKLDLDRQSLNRDFTVYENNVKDLDIREAEVKTKEKGIGVELDKLAKLKDEIYCREQAVKGSEERLYEDQKFLDQERNKFKTDQDQFMVGNESLEKDKGEFEKYRLGVITHQENLEKDLLKRIDAFDKEKSGIQDALKHRELEIVRREKDLEAAEQMIKSKKEQLEIEEGRKKTKKG